LSKRSLYSSQIHMYICLLFSECFGILLVFVIGSRTVVPFSRFSFPSGFGSVPDGQARVFLNSLGSDVRFRCHQVFRPLSPLLLSRVFPRVLWIIIQISQKFLWLDISPFVAVTGPVLNCVCSFAGSLTIFCCEHRRPQYTKYLRICQVILDRKIEINNYFNFFKSCFTTNKIQKCKRKLFALVSLAPSRLIVTDRVSSSASLV
jgi:hypothetical protein